MASLLVVDTDILIDAGRGDTLAVARLQQEEQQQVTLAVSTVTYLELLVGCRNKREQQRTGASFAASRWYRWIPPSRTRR